MERSGAQGTASAAHLAHYLTPLNVWALSFGCIIGWGAFVMPATTLLPIAGPLGTVAALAIGACIIGVIAANFHYMCSRYPSSGGAFTFTKHVFGYDHAFLCAWSLVLAYVSIMWANATAFVLISRYLFGPVFQVGFHYQVAGYDVFAGEIAVTLCLLVAAGLFSCARKRVVNACNTVLAVVLLAGLVVCFGAVVAHNVDNPASFNPPFAPEGIPAAGVFNIVALAPWAFVGFESVSHAAGEFSFPNKRMVRVIGAAIACGALVYIMTSLMTVLGTPRGFDSWATYVSVLGSLDGANSLPVFHAVAVAAGSLGVGCLDVVVLSALATSLFGLYRVSSRLVYTMAQEGMMPEVFGKLNADAVPRNAVLLIMCVSLVVPFVGRAAIGWIVDVTTVSASIAYGYASACALRVARQEHDTARTVTGAVGLAASAVFFVFPLVPNIWQVNALATESYLILAAWSMLGLLAFFAIFRRDTSNRFGTSTVVWIALVFLVLFASAMWVRQDTHATTENVVMELSEYYADEFQDKGVVLGPQDQRSEDEFLGATTGEIRNAFLNSSVVQLAMIVFSLILMFNIYSLMRRREREVDLRRVEAEETSRAKTIFLSNMSHDIRTTMNAITGYTHLAQREGTTPEQAQEYLAKIAASNKHLLALINDVLEMSRIESGRMDLEPTETDLLQAVEELREMFDVQMAEKGIAYTVDASEVADRLVMCDKARFNRIVLNLLSNAYKFTPAGGQVHVTIRQLPCERDGFGTYELRVEDTGIGMSAEFAQHVFEAFERERDTTTSGVQGTGLGMAITKNIVDLMGGSISVRTAPGEGTEFTVRVDFELVDGAAAQVPAADAVEAAAPAGFEAKRVLLVEDNEINREIATLVLEDMGFEVETAENGQVGVDKVRESEPGYYDVVLMDVMMPVMNGYDAAKAIRALPDPQLARVPIVAASANAFAEDVQAALDAGMDAHLSKPLDVGMVAQVLSEVLGS